MKEQLKQLLELPKGQLKFQDDQIDFMLDNLGNLDSYLRDDLIYSLFARGFSEKSFAKDQIHTIVSSFIQKKYLFIRIDKTQNDLFF